MNTSALDLSPGKGKDSCPKRSGTPDWRSLVFPLESQPLRIGCLLSSSWDCLCPTKDVMNIQATEKMMPRKPSQMALV